jgi:hypothetical protein
MPGLSRSTSATENAGRLSNWLRSIVVSVWPVGAWYSRARATLGVMPAVCEAAGAGLAEGGLACCVRADVRAAGLRAAGLGVATRGASTVTAGNAVWAFVFEGERENALQSTSRLALPSA